MRNCRFECCALVNTGLKGVSTILESGFEGEELTNPCTLLGSQLLVVFDLGKERASEFFAQRGLIEGEDLGGAAGCQRVESLRVSSLSGGESLISLLKARQDRCDTAGLLDLLASGGDRGALGFKSRLLFEETGPLLYEGPILLRLGEGLSGLFCSFNEGRLGGPGLVEKLFGSGNDVFGPFSGPPLIGQRIYGGTRSVIFRLR